LPARVNDPPGMGVAKIADAGDAIGFDGYVSLECRFP
jgi:hypothetical protein